MGTAKELLSHFFDAFAHFSIISKAEANPILEAGMQAQTQLLEAEAIRRARSSTFTAHPANRFKGDIAVAHTESKLLPRVNFGDDTQHMAVDLADGSSIETVPSQVRITVHHQDGEAYPTVKAFHVDNSLIPSKKVGIDSSGQMSVQLSDDSSKGKIYWTPVHEDDPDWYLTPNHDDNFELDNVLVQPVSYEEGMDKEEFPLPTQKDWRDAILVFPSDTGIPPLYVVYSKRNNNVEIGKFDNEIKLGLE